MCTSMTGVPTPVSASRNRDAVVTEGARIDDDRVGSRTVQLDRVDQFTFVVRLNGDDLSRTGSAAAACASRPPTMSVPMWCAIDSRFARPEQIQIRTIEHQKPAIGHQRVVPIQRARHYSRRR